jgi:hypothetical protein
MTPTQYTALVTTMRRVESKVDAIEERLAFVYPTEGEACAQVEAELAAILSTGGGVRVFADD